MSGIAGIIRLDGASVAPGQMEAMVATMARRGPDRQAGWCGANAGLGQVLLATTPEAHAETQPWAHPESGCVIVSDSRLDNRQEVLRALGVPHLSADEIGDGALLHAAWQRWGEGCVDHLLGDFAFAVWDPGKQALFCARDVMGVRPFYYHLTPDRLFAFASETGALLAVPDVPKEIDEGRIADALVGELEGIDRTSTFFTALVRLPPAQTLRLERGRLWRREYWHPLMHRPSGLPRSEAEWIEALHDQLREAVRRRLRGSQRVGSMLSGGLDSSSVVALASELLHADGVGPLPTFSAIDSKGECPETRAVRSMLQSFELEATTIDVQSIEDVAPTLRESLPQLSEPFDGTMMLISGQYQAAAARGVRCLLDGMPADNLYTTNGYVQQLARRGRWLQAYREGVESFRREETTVPELRALKQVIGGWAPDAWRRFRQWRHGRAFVATELMDKTLIHREFARRVGLWSRYRRYQSDMLKTNTWDRSGQAVSCMSAAYITAAVERYGRVAAFHGVEPRHPFLDQHLIECHAWLPVEYRSRDGWTKWALRQSMRRHLPPDIAWRRGKEHLGQRFNTAVFGRLLETDVPQASDREASSRVIDSRKAGAAQDAWRKRRDAQSFEALLSAALVELWLRALRSELLDTSLAECIKSRRRVS